jgi:hypothetical protein
MTAVNPVPQPTRSAPPVPPEWGAALAAELAALDGHMDEHQWEYGHSLAEHLVSIHGWTVLTEEWDDALLLRAMHRVGHETERECLTNGLREVEADARAAAARWPFTTEWLTPGEMNPDWEGDRQ